MREREGGRGRGRETLQYIILKEYDYLFDIEIDDGGQHMRKLKLPYNKAGNSTCTLLQHKCTCTYCVMYIRTVIPSVHNYNSTLSLPLSLSDDPYVAAEQFLQANNIPSWYLDQVRIIKVHVGLTFISSLPIQVAEFIMKNADVQHVNQGYSDPFTGTCTLCTSFALLFYL